MCSVGKNCVQAALRHVWWFDWIFQKKSEPSKPKLWRKGPQGSSSSWLSFFFIPSSSMPLNWLNWIQKPILIFRICVIERRLALRNLSNLIEFNELWWKQTRPVCTRVSTYMHTHMWVDRVMQRIISYWWPVCGWLQSKGPLTWW